MAVQFRGKRPAGLSTPDFVAQVRSYSGVPSGSDTTFPQLEAALRAYGLSYDEIPASLIPAPSAQVATMMAATSSGSPVIALIHGADLGRITKKGYGDHWVVVTGFSGQTVFVNDPDIRTGTLPSGWVNGGQITLSLSTFSTAAYDAQTGPYGIVVH
jgi:Peptidase_C39 like family